MCEHPRQDISKHRILTQVILSVLTQLSRSLPNSTVGAREFMCAMRTRWG